MKSENPEIENQKKPLAGGDVVQMISEIEDVAPAELYAIAQLNSAELATMKAPG
jgi:hypothetical protein